MAYFPFMIDIAGKDCYIVGGGNIAYRKAMELLSFGAEVTAAAPEICSRLRAVPEITIRQKEYEEADIENRFLVIAATDQADLNRRIADDCRKRQILVNAVDMKDACSFIFPAVIKKNELVVSISTGGNSPAGAAWLKKKLADCIPDAFEKNIEVLGKMRDTIMYRVTDAGKRRQLYYDLLEMADEKQCFLDEEMISTYIENEGEQKDV